MAAPFDDHDKHSLSIFVDFERNMLSPKGSWMQFEKKGGVAQ